jgi:hypothetical protein
VFDVQAETLVGQITSAFAVGLRMGPVRLDFTNQRFVVVSSAPPSLPPAIALFRAWKASLPLPPHFQLVDSPYLQDPGEIWTEIPNNEVASVRARREIGLGIDRTMSQLTVDNIRRGIEIGSWGKGKPGVPVRSMDAISLMFRVPAPPEGITAFLLQTPLAGVVIRK